MGEIVGMAASICKKRDCTPRDVYRSYYSDLQKMMEIGAGQQDPIMANSERQWVMPARDAIISGRQLRYEANRDSLGYWRSLGDEARWLVEIDTAGRFALELEIACDEGHAGGEFEIRVGNELPAQRHRVESTGTWDQYELFQIGEFSLPAGLHEIRVRSQKKQGPLMKLRSARMIKK